MDNIKSYLFLLALVIYFLPTQAQPLVGNQLYEPVTPQPEKMAMAPVERLMSHLDKGQWHMMREPFMNKPKCDDFCGKFNMLDNDGLIRAGCFRKNFIQHETMHIIPLSSSVFPPFEIRV